MDQNICLARTFGQILYLGILDLNFAAQKLNVAFEPLDIAIVLGRERSRMFAIGRGCSPLFVVVRRFSFWQTIYIVQGANGRVRSRMFANIRAGNFVDVGDVARHRIGRDKIFLTELGFNFSTIELGYGTIFLDRAIGARVSRLHVDVCRFFDRQLIFAIFGAFAAVRERSRLFVVHALDDNARRETPRSSYPQWGRSSPLQVFALARFARKMCLAARRYIIINGPPPRAPEPESSGIGSATEMYMNAIKRSKNIPALASHVRRRRR
jgi:hypothetical protein